MSKLAIEDLIAMIIACGAAIWLLVSFDHGVLWKTLISLVLLTSSASLCGHFLKRRWSHLFAGITFALASVQILVSAMTNGWTIMRGLFVIACPIFAWNLVRKSFNRQPGDESDERDEGDGEDQGMVSIVALVRELPFLDDKVLSRHVTNAWGIEMETGDEDASAFVVGEAPLFVVQCDHGMFLVHYHDRPYFDEPEEVAASTRDMRLIHVIENHAAWFSVDLMSSSGEPDELASEFALIGKLLAEIVDDDCLGLLLPAHERLLPWEPEFADALVSDNPLEAFCPELLPVVQISDDDPRMKAAVAEARESFPKFERAFENRSDPDQSWAVKAPITGGGNTEFIWIAVTGIENGIIYGDLANDPVDLGGLQEGDRVRVEVANLNDWMYTTDDDFEGGFTVKLLTEIYTEPKDDSE